MLEDLIDWGQYTAAATAIIGLGLLLWSRFVRPLVVEPVRSRAQHASAFVRRVGDVCETVERELRPNGGSSIRDTITRIEIRQIATEALSLATIQQMDAAVWRADRQGRCDYVSRALCRLTQRSADELKGFGWRNIVPESERESVMEEWTRAVREEREFSMHFEYQRPDGSRVPVLGEAFVMRDHGGRVIGFLGKATPIGADAPTG